jgi:hypothetical protein
VQLHSQHSLPDDPTALPPPPPELRYIHQTSLPCGGGGWTANNNKEQPALSASPYPLYGRVVPRADRTDSAYTEELSVEDYREGYGDEQMVASKM